MIAGTAETRPSRLIHERFVTRREDNAMLEPGKIRNLQLPLEAVPYFVASNKKNSLEVVDTISITSVMPPVN